MSELRQVLAEGVSGFAPDADDALTSTLRLASSRQLRIRVATFAVAAVLSGAAITITWIGLGSLRAIRPGTPPLPGPTSSATPRADRAFDPQSGTTFCDVGNFGGEDLESFCLTRTSDVVTAASGHSDGRQWRVKFFAARYTGPYRGNGPAESPRQRAILMVCVGWEWRAQSEWVCEGTPEDGVGFGISLGPRMQEETDPEPAPPVSGDVRPLQRLEDGGGAGLTVPVGSDRLHLGWTAAETERVLVFVDSEPWEDARLLGPLEEINRNLKFLIAVTPSETAEVAFVARTASGEEIWRDRDHYSADEG